MRPFKDHDGFRVYRPPPPHDENAERPPPLWVELLGVLAVAAIVFGILSLAGCSVPTSTSTTQTKRDAIGPLAETAAASQRVRPLDDDEPVYRAAGLPTSMEAYTVPGPAPTLDDVAPAWEPNQPPITPQTPNASPCGPEGCKPPVFVFRRRRR